MELSAVLKKSIAMLKVYGNISEVSNGNSGSSKTISWASGQVQSITLNQNTTLTFDFSLCPVGRYQLRIIQDGTGGRTVTWSTSTPGTTKWLNSVGAPALNGAISGESIAVFFWDGTNCYGSIGRVNVL